MATSARWQEALALLYDIRREGVVPDQHSYSAASEFQQCFRLYMTVICNGLAKTSVAVDGGDGSSKFLRH